jgi:polysaccharide biosynthesis transport protein
VNTVNTLTVSPMNRGTMSTNTLQNTLTIKEVWHLLVRRRRAIGVTVLVCLVLASVYCIVSTRRYRAAGTVQVQEENSDALGLDTLLNAAGGSGDALNATLNLETEASILESDTLALKTVDDLKLEDTRDFRAGFSAVGWAMGLIGHHSPTDPPGLPLAEAPLRRTRALDTFSKNLAVTVVPGTRLIEIDYVNSDPKVSANVVNHLMQMLMDFNFQTRYAATAEASKWLTGQLTDLRKQSEDLQAKVAQLQKESGVFSLGTVDSQGREQAYSATLDRLQQVTTALTEAEQNRILKGAIYETVKSGNAELISGLGGNALAGASPGINNSLGLIQSLRQQQAMAQAEVAQAEAKFGPAYPKLAELRGNIAGFEKAIQQEVGRLASRAQNDFGVATKAEDQTRARYEQDRKLADTLNDKAIEYTIVRQEAEQSRTLYEDLLKRLKEAGVVEGLRSSNITVVSPGRIPAKPAQPKIPMYMAGALGGGLFLGCCVAFLLDALDNKIHDIDSVEGFYGQRLLGVVPSFHDSAFLTPLNSERNLLDTGDKLHLRRLIVLESPNSSYTEALRALRTSLILARSAGPPQLLLVTSSLEGEGKSTLSTSLAVLVAQHGKKVLLVDADLRRTSLGRNASLGSKAGLSTLLADQSREEDVIIPVEEVPNLSVLPAGPRPPHPAELLGSEHMNLLIQKWRGEFDFIVMDGAPVLPVTDSVVLSTMADMTLLIARYRMTERQALERSYQMLQFQNPGQRVELVLNGVECKEAAFHDYFGYKESSYHA